MSEKNVLKKFQMSEQYCGCSDKMSEVNFSPAETLQTNKNHSKSHITHIKVVNQIFKPKLSMIKVFGGNKAETKMKLYFLLSDPTPSNISYVM